MGEARKLEARTLENRSSFGTLRRQVARYEHANRTETHAFFRAKTDTAVEIFPGDTRIVLTIPSGFLLLCYKKYYARPNAATSSSRDRTPSLR